VYERGGAGLGPGRERVVCSQSSYYKSLGIILGVCAAWVALYLLNHWAFKDFEVSEHLSWVFLPAAIRMLAALLFGWLGVTGLFLGSFLTGYYSMLQPNWFDVAVLAAISSISPMVALIVCMRVFKFDTHLVGLNAKSLIGLSFLAAALTAGFHNMRFVYSGHMPHFFDGFVPMFAGDLIGTFLVLYGFKWVFLRSRVHKA
jgi:hypothetical protein